jgi:hypothetical protein
MENMEALVQGIKDGAAQRGLKILDALFSGDPDVLFRYPDTGPDDVLDVALHVSAPFLTLDVATLDPAELTERPGILGEATYAGPPPAGLQRRWEERSGEVDRIYLQWTAAGTTYLFAASPEWAKELVAARDAWFEQLDDEESDAVGAHWARVAELAGKLEADPDYRGGTTHTRRAIGQAFLEPLLQSAPGEKTALHQALDEAGKLVRANAQTAYSRLLSDLDTLTAEVRDTAAWKTARKQYQLRAAASDFLQKRSGGYSPPTKTVETLVNAAAS